MNKLVYVAVIIILLGMVYFFTPKGQSQAETLDDGIRLAQEQDKLVFLYINSKWCTYCRLLEQQFAQSSEFKQLIEEHYIWVTLDFDQNLALAQQLGLRGPPAMIIIDKNRTVLTGIPGYPPNGVQDVIAMLKEASK